MGSALRDDVVTMTGPTNRTSVVNTSVVGGVALCVAIVLADLIAGTDVILIPLLVTAPLVTAVRGTAHDATAVGALALVFAIALGWVDDIEGTWRHWVIIGTVIVGTAFAVPSRGGP